MYPRYWIQKQEKHLWQKIGIPRCSGGQTGMDLVIAIEPLQWALIAIWMILFVMGAKEY